jgi:imidazolonepropionase
VHGAADLVVGPAADGLERIEDGALAAVEGTVAAVGSTESVTAEYPIGSADAVVDATGRTVLPGFVDPHTHALFAGDRSDEFAAKLRGKSYQDILAEGGGILRTVRAVRAASDETLLENLLAHLDVMLAHGTTTVEVKSGYGLDRETELRMLDVIAAADERHPVDVVATFMGAHAVPEELTTEEYVTRVIEDQLPAVADQGVAEFCDVFCEAGVFDRDQSRRILEAGAEHGLTPKIHADEFERLGGVHVAADLGAASADHLLQSTEADVEAATEASVVPVMLPGTAFGLGGDYADAEAFLEAGAPVALATDFNPNCYSQSMPFAIALGCTGMRMTPAEALVGATHDAALAIERADGLGTLTEGSPADFLLVDAPSHVHVPYNVGVNPVAAVFKRGRRVTE